MKNKIFLSFTLFISSLLVFVISVFAWITLGNSGNAGNINPGIYDINCNVKMEKLVNTEWKEINTIDNLDLINPNDFVYYRLTFSSKTNNDVTISNCRFSEVSSNISDELKYENDKIFVMDNKNNKIDLYDVVNDTVIVDDKTLYTITESNILLGDFKVSDCLRFYVINDTSGINSNDSSFFKNSEMKSLNSNLFDFQKIDQGSSYSVVFALELNYDAMKINNVDYSYCYSYQTFNIKSIIADVK